MITRTHALPVVRQCQLLGLSRSTASDQPTLVSVTDLTLMRRIDALHLAPSVCRRSHAAGPLAERRPCDGAAARRDPDEAHGQGRWCIASRTPVSGIPPTQSLPLTCATWRSSAPITSGRRTSPPAKRALASKTTSSPQQKMSFFFQWRLSGSGKDL